MKRIYVTTIPLQGRLDLVARRGDRQDDFLPARHIVKDEFAQQRPTSLRLARDLRQTDLVQKLGCNLLDI